MKRLEIMSNVMEKVLKYTVSAVICFVFALSCSSNKSNENAQAGENNNENDYAIEMVDVKGGTFVMGSRDIDNDTYGIGLPAHEVTLSDFRIGKYEVTQKQWNDIMGENPSVNQMSDNLPVDHVSWNRVQEFIQKLNEKTGRNYRLPTEAEWEYAARGGSLSKDYKYSGSNDIDNVGWYYGNLGSETTTHPIGSKAPNELGIYDMTGNVWEWCSDWRGDYYEGSQRDPQGPESGDKRVARGGSWSFYEWESRPTDRKSYNPDFRDGSSGFRLAE